MNTISESAYAGDIVSRLRNWRGLHLAHGGELYDDAADEIASLREAIRRLAEQDATLSVCDGNVTVTMDGTLTDAEREAVGELCEFAEEFLGRDDPKIVALRVMLERLGVEK